MRQILQVLAVSLSISIVSSAAAAGPPASSDAAAKIAIRRALEQWPRDFADKKIAAVCGLFAPDLIATYPGASDRTYDTMCSHLTRVLHDPGKSFRYDPPQIEEIIVSGSLSVVRLTWTLHVAAGSAKETIRERGMDLFQRQHDGSWKIRISYAYTQPAAHTHS